MSIICVGRQYYQLPLAPPPPKLPPPPLVELESESELLPPELQELDELELEEEDQLDDESELQAVPADVPPRYRTPRRNSPVMPA